MADYISTLTGIQMDASLIDMAEHTSEAYAVGERNGVPVDSSDVTYHNNARYYAQQAQSIAPASVTEAVRWDVAQTALTDAQREQARENINATPYNYNLLDNSWFLVNSRGQNSYTASGYTVDRWARTGGNPTVSVLSPYGISIANTGDSNVDQIVNVTGAELNGKIMTLSVLTDSGVSSATGVFDTSGNGYKIDLYFASGAWRCRLGWFTSINATHPFIRIANTTSGVSTTAIIRAVKLELGSFSTLANDTSPDYGEELTRCIYSTADPTDTYANNGFGRSNPNLLDNPWFTIRQRGDGPFSGANTAAMDRWRATSNSTITCTTNGITITTTVKKWGMQYRVTKDFFIVGKTYTISALEQDGTITNATFTWTGNGLSIYPTGSNVGVEVSTANGSYDIIYFTTSEVGSVYLRAVKLELGSVSTLANDTPPDYGTELLKCQRYFIRINAPYYNNGFGIGRATGGTTCLVFIPLPVPLRASPSVSYSNAGNLQLIGNGSNYAVTALAYSGRSEVGVNLSVTTSGISVNQLYFLTKTSQDCYIDISADL